MFYSNFPQTGINSNVLQNTSELITQSRVKKVQNEFFPQEYGYEDTYKKKYDSMDDPTFWYTIRHGEVPKGYYAIQVREMRDDVRLVSTAKEKKLFNNDYPRNECQFNNYKAVLDEDGIHAKVVINELNVQTKICSNCQRLFISDSLQYSAHKNYFCSNKCEHEYLHNHPDNKVLRTICYIQKKI